MITNNDMHSSASLIQTLGEDLIRYNSKRKGFLGALEAFFFTPGFSFLVFHRLAVQLYKGGAIKRVLALVLWRYNVFASGCHISLRATLGPGLLLPHPTAIVIGDGVTLGAGVTLYQSVTLGIGKEGGYPQLQSKVTVFPGAVIVGNITVGESATVGANAFVSKDVASRTVVAGVPAAPTSTIRLFSA